MSSRPRLPRIPREARLPAVAVASVVIAVIVVLLSAGSSQPTPISATAITATTGMRPAVAGETNTPAAGTRAITLTTTTTIPKQNKQPSQPFAGTQTAAGGQVSLRREVGQLIIGTYAGTVPPQPMLDAVKAGEVGAVIMMGDNTSGGTASVKAATHELQVAAHAGGNPGLLIMTDQEGGQVKRLPGAPDASAAQMGAAGDAQQQGFQTGQLLRSVGINVDLAPVADVARVDGFINREQRSFARTPDAAAAATCAFARGLDQAKIAYTLKHFPGLGSAIRSTDGAPVHVTETQSDLAADVTAYGLCGSGPRTLVMVSSASYQGLTGYVPAVLDPVIYQRVIPGDGIHAVTISDSFESGAIQGLASPALTALNAGLDMVMYPGYESASANAYTILLQDAQQGALNRTRLNDAYGKILTLKQTLGLA